MNVSRAVHANGLSGAVDSGNVPLNYEVAAIGILAQAAATEEFVLPSGGPLDEREGLPIVPGAISGEAANDGYQITIQADLDEITGFYETELSNLGFELELTVLGLTQLLPLDRFLRRLHGGEILG